MDCNIKKFKKVDVNVGKKITNYRLRMVGKTQNKEKCLISIVVSRGRKKLIRLELKEEYLT